MIKVRHISKKYRISHQERYLALRDTLTNCLKKPFNLLRGKSFGATKEDFWALKDISFDIKKGEVVGIIGRNGAGKSTLLKILSRITYPTKGEIRLHGRVGSLLEVGTGFHPELTGRENIYFNGSIMGMKKKEIDRKFDEIVDFSGTEKFLDTPVKRFSSGMQVRLAFSVAAHLDPEILLVDEVLAVGDTQFQKKCLGKIKDVSKGGRTILFVSHNMSAIKNLCDRTILLEDGKKLMDDRSEEVISRYLDQNLSQGTRILGQELDHKMETVAREGAPNIHLKEVSLTDAQGALRGCFQSDEAIVVNLSYECLTTVHSLRIDVQIVDEENRSILVTQNVDDPNELRLYQRNPGIYKSSFIIPPNTFGEEHFYVSLQIIYPAVEHIVFNKILGFDVDFQGYNNVNDNKISKSFLRPCLKWKTQFCK